MNATKTQIEVITTPAARRRTKNFHFVVCVESGGVSQSLPGVNRIQDNAVAVARRLTGMGLHERVWVEKRAGM